MRHLEGEQDYIDCFDADVYIQERNVIYFMHEGNPNQRVTLYADNVQVAVYQLDAAGKVTIDVTDYLRAYPNTQSFKTVCTKEGDTINIPLQVVGLIRPDSVLVPNNVNADRLRSNLFVTWPTVVVPPQMILSDLGNAGTRVSMEFWPTDAESLNYGYFVNDDESDLPISREVELPLGAKRFYTFNDDATNLGNIQDVRLKPLDCGKKYASVEWVSYTGATRRHTFEVRGCNFATGYTTKLETVDGSFNVIKGRQEGCVCALEGLNAYDLWYYADVLTSSSVRISFDGTTWQRVNVTTKSITIPDGDAGEFNKLEIQITYKEYDAVAM